MKVSVFKRISTAYITIGTTFGAWFSPLVTALIMVILRICVALGQIIDRLFFFRALNKPLNNTVLIVGNPRSGTTFFQRYLVNNGIGVGSQIWQMLYPSISLQKMIKPFLPLLEKLSPTRHHSKAAHVTGLQSVEADDASIFFRFYDGFFLYGFILSWAEEDLFEWIDPRVRDTTQRDYKWLESIWLRNQYVSGMDRSVAKLFSLSAVLPQFLEKFSDSNSKILYVIRDPLFVIPSGLSLVTGVLDKRFGFWNLPSEKRQIFINRLYRGLLHLLLRFHEDWTNGRIDKSRVFIVHYDRIMTDFDNLMGEVLEFIDHFPSETLKKDIKETAEKQRKFKSEHKYDLEKFGLNEEQIKSDCAPIYKTFLHTVPGS